MIQQPLFDGTGPHDVGKWTVVMLLYWSIVYSAPATVPVSVRNGPLHSAAVDFTFAEPPAPGSALAARMRRS